MDSTLQIFFAIHIINESFFRIHLKETITYGIIITTDT